MDKIYNTAGLERDAVDVIELATNFNDVVPSCCGDEFDPAAELMTRHPLYDWLYNTELSRRMRQEIADRGLQCILVKDDQGQFELKVPGLFWTLDPETSDEDCCFPPMDFAKCAGRVPVDRLCVKECDSIDDINLGRLMRQERSYGEVARRGETYNETKRRISRLSMAFYTVRNLILGQKGVTAPGLRSFHGLFDVMNNPAIFPTPGGNLLATFQTLACRIRAFGGDFSGYAAAVNPVIHQTILSLIKRDQYGNYPEGWTRDGDSLAFYGMRIIPDRFVPFNMTTNKGEVWILASDAVGMWLATDLLVGDDFIKTNGFQEESLADGCGSQCWYYYNYGTVFNNDSRRLMRIVDVPASAYCTGSIGYLGAIINPTTLIPR